MNEENLDLNEVEVTEENKLENSLTELQIYGVNTNTVRLLSKIRQYIVLTQIQMDLIGKSHSIQPIMREIYQFEETKMIMSIREEFDMFRAYTTDHIVLKNVNSIREKFEFAISFVTGNMQNVESVHDKNYVQILDTFADKLQNIASILTKKSVLNENFNQ